MVGDTHIRYSGGGGFVCPLYPLRHLAGICPTSQGATRRAHPGKSSEGAQRGGRVLQRRVGDDRATKAPPPLSPRPLPHYTTLLYKLHLTTLPLTPPLPHTQFALSPRLDPNSKVILAHRISRMRARLQRRPASVYVFTSVCACAVRGPGWIIYKGPRLTTLYSL